MVPPALSEVGQFVLRRQLDDLLKDLPEMQDVSVSYHERRQEPVAPMNREVVVHVVPQVLKSEIAVVVVGVHASADDLVKAGVKELKAFSAKIGSAVQHED